MSNTRNMVVLISGIILVALAMQGMQLFFVDMVTNYNVDQSFAENFSYLNSTSFEKLQNASAEIEEALGSDEEPATGLASFTNFFDTSWSVLWNGLKSLSITTGMNTEMIQGAGQGALGVEAGWITGGLIILVTLVILIWLVGWGLNRS